MKKDPSSVEMRKCRCFFAGTEGGDEAEQEADGEDKDAEGDGFVAPGNEQESQCEKKAEERLGFVGINGKTVVRRVEHLDERDEVEEDRRGGCRNSNMPPTGTVIQRCRKDSERGNAVEENRDSEPEEGHEILLMAGGNWPQSSSISCEMIAGFGVGVMIAVVPPSPVLKYPKSSKQRL